MLCSEWTLVKRSKPGLNVLPLRCKCWTCELCAPIRAAKLVKEAARGRPNILVTLTSRNVPGTCPDAAARALVCAFRQVRAEYLDEHGPGAWEFLAVFERTKKGWPHLHIACRAKWIDQRWLSRRMGALIGAPIVDVRKAFGGPSLGAYLAKYIGKDPYRFAGTKRYWRSKYYLFASDLINDTEEEGYFIWWIEKYRWQTVVRRLKDAGYIPEFTREGAFCAKGLPP